MQEQGRAWGVECKYIPNGADPVDGPAGAPPAAFDPGPSDFVLVYTGDKARWKRTEDICRAMRSLPENVKLYLTGRDYDYLKPYYSANCIPLGWLTKEEQYAVMSRADAFVCTSDQDCNAKLQEYLRWHKPVLGYDGEANRFFRNGHNALLAKDGDYVPLVRRLLDEPGLAAELVRNADAEIPVYSWREIALRFEEYFTSLLRGARIDSRCVK